MEGNPDRDLVPEDVAYGLMNQAKAAHQRGDLQGELDATRQLLSIAQQEGRAGLEIEVLRQLGNAYQALGNLRYAHAYRMAARETADQYAGHVPLKLLIRVDIDLGRSFIEVQDWEKAESYTRRALADSEKLGDDRERQELEAVLLNNLSQIYARTGRKGQGLELLQKTLGIAETLGDVYLLGLAHLNLSAYYLNVFRLTQSQKHAREAYRYTEISRDPLQRAQAQLLLGGIHNRSRFFRDLGSYSASAVDHLERTVRLAQNLGNPMMTAEAEIELAIQYEQSGQVSEAGQHFHSALTALEQVRTDLGYEQFQLTFFASLQDQYEQAILFQLQNGQLELAFQTMERLRSRLLLTLLGPGRWDLSDWTEAEQAALQDVLTRFGAQALEQIFGQSTAGSEPSFTIGLSDTSQDLLDRGNPALRQARQDFLDLYYNQRAHRLEWLGRQSPPIASLADVQRMLADQEALIAYLCARDGLFILCLTRDSAHFQHLNLPRRKLEEQVARLCQEMSDLQEEVLDPFMAEQWFQRNPEAPWPARLKRRMAALQDSLDRLYALLIAPVLPAIHTRTHWIVMPNGPLHRVPWAALHSRAGYLVESRSLSLLPSASIGVALDRTVPGSTRQVISLGDPDPDQPGLSLPAARLEVQTVQQAFPGALPPLLGQEASKANFLKWAPKAQLLHLACHHCFDGSAPLLSFVKLNGDRGDEFLYTFEVADLELQASLVTLSACESGRSQIATGDEQFGIVRSFLAAGAQSVISTLWHIQDRSASVFFSDFYRLARQLPLDQALAETQRRLLASPVYQLPCFWAPYVLTGKWREPLVV